MLITQEKELIFSFSSCSCFYLLCNIGWDVFSSQYQVPESELTRSLQDALSPLLLVGL